MLIGRGEDVRLVCGLLEQAEVLTLVGAGGIGKTALADACCDAMAARFPSPVRIDLATVATAADIDVAVAEAMGVVLRRSGTLLDAMREKAAAEPRLYVFDGAEHMDDALRSLLASLMPLAPGSGVLVTSRRPLRAAREVTYEVGPLAPSDAASLYRERRPAASAAEATKAIATLDGHPLAVELAAAGVSGGPTLAATIEHTVASLSPEGVDLLEALTAYPAGLPAGEGIEELLRHSLVVVHEGRYRLLDPIREALDGVLQDDRREAIRNARWRRCADQVLAARAALFTHAEADAVADVRTDLPNIRAALAASFDDDPETGVELVVALSQFWTILGNTVDAERWLGRALPVAGDAAAEVRARIGFVLQTQGRFDEARPHFEFALDAAERDDVLPMRAAALHGLGQQVMVERDIDAAERNFLEAIEAADACGETEIRVLARFGLGSARRLFARYASAREATEAALEVARAVGSQRGEALCLSQLGSILQVMGERDSARAALLSAREIAARVGFRSALVAATGALGSMAMEEKDYDGARVLLEDALRLSTEAGDHVLAMVTRLNLASNEFLAGEYDRAFDHATHGNEAAKRLQQPRLEAQAEMLLGEVAAARVDFGQALERQRRSLAIRHGIGDSRGVATSFDVIADLLAQDGDPGRAAQLIGAADRVWAATGGARAPDVQESIEAARTRARTVLGHQDAQRLEEVGASLDMERAIEVALEVVSKRAAVRTLGSFGVTSEGHTVAPNVFGSKKARDLLKMLVCHRGAVVPREVLGEALWPDAEANGDAIANRLRVALAGVRRALGAAELVHSTRDGVSLDLTAVDVDVERFLAAAAAGRWAEAESLHAGTFLPEDLYEDWSVRLREEVRRTYVRACHAQLADADPERALVLATRILEYDEYDEEANGALVNALIHLGRRGEAERARADFAARLDDLGS